MGRMVIAKCISCGNSSELLGDTCEDCLTKEEEKFNGTRTNFPKDQGQSENGQFSIVPVVASTYSTPPDVEKSQYLGDIESKLTEANIESIVKDLVTRRIFHSDIIEVLKNPRWFTTVDLARLSKTLKLKRKRTRTSKKKDTI